MFLEQLNALYFYIEDFIRRYTKMWGIAVTVKKNTLEISAQKEGGNYCPHLTSVCWILEA